MSFGLAFLGSEVALAQSFCDTINLVSENYHCAGTIASNVNIGQFYNDFVVGERSGIVFDAGFLNSSSRQALEFNGDLSIDQNEFDTWNDLIIGSTGATREDVTLSAFQQSNIITPFTADIRVGTLTLDNVDFGFRINPTGGGIRGGNIARFQVGSGDAGNRVGVLVLNNASLDVPPETVFAFGSPTGSVPEINVLGGLNTLRFRTSNFESPTLRLHIASNAILSLESGTVAPDTAGTLVMERGSELRFSNLAELDLRQDTGTGLARTTLDGASIMFDTGELQISNPLINDTTITLDRGALRILGRTTQFGEVEFIGTNRISFVDAGSVFTGSIDATSRGILRVTGGTTVIDSAGSTASGGLLMNRFIIDGGTLDLTGYTDDSPLQRQWLEDISVSNGGFYRDREFNYEALELLTVDHATLSSQSEFGSYGSGDGGTIYRFTDTVFDVFGSTPPPGSFAPTLGSLTLNSQNLVFAGQNLVRIGIDPSGQCLVVGGSCVPGSIRYSGQLNTNVGNGFATQLTGFDTLTFIPMASNSSATSNEYLIGGANGMGVYTISVANDDASLITDGSFGIPAPVGYDARPDVPSLQDLHDAGSTIPANLGYVIVNAPLSDDQVDIAFVDLGLTNHPSVVSNYTHSVVTRPIIDPSTGNTTTITVTITPNANGTATQTTGISVTAPGGGVISTSSVVALLNPPTGTINTTGAANLIASSGTLLTHNGLSDLLTSFHPEPYASFMTVGVEQSDMVRNMVLDRAGGLSFSRENQEYRTESGRRVWLDAGFVLGSVDGSQDLGGFEYSLWNVIAGVDVLNTDAGTLGLFVGYGRQSMDEHDIATQSFSSNNYHLGAYGYSSVGNWDVRSTLGYSFGRNESSRLVRSDVSLERNEADYDSHMIYMGAAARHQPLLASDLVNIRPEFGLGYTLYQQERVTESGASFSALTIAPETTHSVVTSVGLEAEVASIGDIQPIGFVRFERDWYAAQSDAHQIEASLVSASSTSQTFVGQNRGANTVLIGLGFSNEIQPEIQIGGGLVFARSDNGEEFGAGFNLRMEF